MDLPATDPGSDMCCDLTDSADEYCLNTSIENSSKEGNNSRGSYKQLRSISPLDNNKKYDSSGKKVYLDVESLPVLRPHTLSFVDDLSDDKIQYKMQRKKRGTRPARFQQLS